MYENNIDKKFKNVLITGASSGIGYELSKIFAQNKFNLILVGRNIDKLRELKENFIKKFSIKVTIIQKDLSLKESAKEIFEEVEKQNINVDILINNAGSGLCGLFKNIDLEKNIEMIELNITSLTILTKLFGDKMIERGYGKILNVASTGAYQPGPYIAVYYATKAYVLSLSQAITNEFKKFGVSVTTLCPGATKTEFSKRAGKMDLKVAMDPYIVAKLGYRGLMRNKKIIIPGFKNKIAIVMSKILPGNILAYTVEKIQKNLLKNR